MMSEKEKIERLRKHIIKSRECFYSEGIDDYLYIKGVRLQELSDIYRSFTNDTLFSIFEMKLINPIMYYAFLEQKDAFINKSNSETISNYKTLVDKKKFIIDEVDLFKDKILNNISNSLATPVRLSKYQEYRFINDYLNKYFENKDLYKEMEAEGRIIYSKNFPVIACTSPSIYNDKDYIFYNSDIVDFNQRSLTKAGILIHEAAHVEDLKSVRDKYGKNQMFDYSSSFFTETNSFLSEFNYIKYLEDLGFNKEVIDEIKKEFVSKCMDMAIRIDFISIFDIDNLPSGVLSSLFQDLRVLYSYTAALLLDDSSLDLKKKFNKEKLITNDITLFDNIDCNIEKVLRKKNLNVV